MRLEGSPDSRRNAKRLRRELTPPEIALWLALRSNDSGLRFRKQYPAGEYVLDFYCAPERLAIEVDGEAHERGDRPARDASVIAGSSLKTCGVRYSAKQVLTNLEGVCRQIIMIAEERRAELNAHRRPPPPSPSAPPPPGGGG